VFSIIRPHDSPHSSSSFGQAAVASPSTRAPPGKHPRDLACSPKLGGSSSSDVARPLCRLARSAAARPCSGGRPSEPSAACLCRSFSQRKCDAPAARSATQPSPASLSRAHPSHHQQAQLGYCSHTCSPTSQQPHRRRSHKWRDGLLKAARDVAMRPVQQVLLQAGRVEHPVLDDGLQRREAGRARHGGSPSR
jgi:hypothetical protein